MNQAPIMAYGFNHQSFYHQPVSNMRQINDVMWNRGNENQQMVISPSYSANPNQQFVTYHPNLQGQPHISSDRNHSGHISRKNYSDQSYQRRMYFMLNYFIHIIVLFRI
jgi:hypothetical protein